MKSCQDIELKQTLSISIKELKHFEELIDQLSGVLQLKICTLELLVDLVTHREIDFDLFFLFLFI